MNTVQEMQLNYSLPDVALNELLLHLTPEELLSIYDGNCCGLELIDDNIESIRKLLKSKEVIRRLCVHHELDVTTTFQDFLLSYEYWNLDFVGCSFEYFAKRWSLTMGVKRCLYVAARNAEWDVRFLGIIDNILKENLLTCSKEHLCLVCSGLVWSKDLQEKYLLSLETYMVTHRPSRTNKKQKIIDNCNSRSKYWAPYSYHHYLLEDEANSNMLKEMCEGNIPILDAKQSELALQILDWHDFKTLTLCEMTRLEKIRLACNNNDGRILRSFKPTLEEILESKSFKQCALCENEEMREKFLDIVLRNPFHGDSHCWYFDYIGYKDFNSRKFRCSVYEGAVISIRNSSRIELTPFFLCFYELGFNKLEACGDLIKSCLPYLITRFTNKMTWKCDRKVYCPEYLQYFIPKYLELEGIDRCALQADLLAVTSGDEGMTEWVDSLQLL